MLRIRGEQGLIILAIADYSYCHSGYISSEVEAWCLERFGPKYKAHLLGFFAITSVTVVYLTADRIAAFYLAGKRRS